MHPLQLPGYAYGWPFTSRVTRLNYFCVGRDLPSLQYHWTIFGKTFCHSPSQLHSEQDALTTNRPSGDTRGWVTLPGDTNPSDATADTSLCGLMQYTTRDATEHRGQEVTSDKSLTLDSRYYWILMTLLTCDASRDIIHLVTTCLHKRKSRITVTYFTKTSRQITYLLFVYLFTFRSLHNASIIFITQSITAALCDKVYNTVRTPNSPFTFYENGAWKSKHSSRGITFSCRPESTVQAEKKGIKWYK